jgi:hypothetical protein
MFEIRKDIANTLYNRELILYGNDLNKLKQPKTTPTAGSGPSATARRRALNFYNGIKTNPKKLIDQVFAGQDYRIIGNVVEFADGLSYNLNNPGGILGLLSNLSQEYYGTGQKEDEILDVFDILVANDPDFDFSNKPKVSTQNVESTSIEEENEFADLKIASKTQSKEQIAEGITKDFDEITNFNSKEELDKKLKEEENKKLADTLLSNFKAGRISSEYLRGSGKPIYENWLKTGGKKGGVIDLSLRSN